MYLDLESLDSNTALVIHYIFKAFSFSHFHLRVFLTDMSLSQDVTDFSVIVRHYQANKTYSQTKLSKLL